MIIYSEKHKGKTRADRKRKLMVLLILCGAAIVLALLAPYMTPHDPSATNSAAINQDPGLTYPLGTDRYGRCVLSRVMSGARTSVLCALLLVGICFLFGTVYGAISGWCGGVVDAVMMRIVDLLLAFPQMVLAIAVAGVLGGSLANAMIALGFAAWTPYARLARSHTLAVKNENYIMAVRLNGGSSRHILLRHVLPNISGPLIVNAATQLGSTMVGIAGLSFLGLGVVPPQAEWGSMIAESRAYIQLAPWSVLAPAACVVLFVMLFNYTGDALRDYFSVSEVHS